MLANRGDKRIAVAREVRVAARDNAHLHALFNFKGNRDDGYTVCSCEITPEHTV